MISLFMSFTASVLIAIVSWMLVANRRYEDGIVGRIALAGMALAATGFASKMVFSCYTPTGLEDALLWSVAVFLGRHYHRFHKFTTTGQHAWHLDEPPAMSRSITDDRGVA